MKANQLRTQTSDQLKSELQELYREQFNLRMQKMEQGATARHAQFKHVRRSIARVKTILTEKTASES